MNDDFQRLLALCVPRTDAAKEGADAPTATAAKPYRERAELFALKDGKVYGGLYDNGTFGVFGGGIDPGEDALQAATREFAEEAGWSIRNPRLITPAAFDYDWKPPYKSTKQARRAEKYRGSRTYYVAGDLGDELTKRPPDAARRQDVRLYDLDEAIRLAALAGVEDDGGVAAHRQEILRLLKASLADAAPAGPAVDKSAGAVYPSSRRYRGGLLQYVASLAARRS